MTAFVMHTKVVCNVQDRHYRASRTSSRPHSPSANPTTSPWAVSYIRELFLLALTKHGQQQHPPLRRCGGAASLLSTIPAASVILICAPAWHCETEMVSVFVVSDLDTRLLLRRPTMRAESAEEMYGIRFLADHPTYRSESVVYDRNYQASQLYALAAYRPF